jgi:GNAT superfamily N-acetyltransferase
VSAAPYPPVDLALARKLERAEGHANARFVESRARVAPDVGARWIEAGGAYAMFDGVGSPLTQTFGLGLFEPTNEATLDVIEGFFSSRKADVFHEVSPLADASILAVLNERGYRPCELTSVLYQELPSALASLSVPGMSVSLAAPDQRTAWAATALAGWSEVAEAREFMSSFGPAAVAAEDAYPFLALHDGAPVAAGMLSIHRDVALLAGASTIPSARGRGAQRALLDARLRFASKQGCTLAMMCAAPGSASQRNGERSGFRIAYTRIKWHKAQTVHA